MVKIFKLTRTMQEMISLDEYQDDCWIHVTKPTSEEVKTLSQKLDIPIDFLKSPLDIDERPRIEVEDNKILVVMRTPNFDESNEGIPFTTVPLGIIVMENLIITVCSKENEVIQSFINRKIRGLSTAKRSRFLLQIFYKTSSLYLDYLKQISKETDLIEEKLRKSMKNRELIELLNFEKSLVYFTTSLKSNELMMERLQRTEILKMYPDDRDLLEDVMIENKQAIEMANIHSNILSGMMDAFASIISNNLNIVMKFLTSVTIILMLPTLVASIYGMNVKLPLQNWPYAFAFTMVLSLVLSIIGITLFIIRRWL